MQNRRQFLPGVLRKKKRTNDYWFLLLIEVFSYTLISTSTPLGNSSFMRASTVLVLLE
jgi:hypothetical protein